jgi:hypothetical protein
MPTTLELVKLRNLRIIDCDDDFPADLVGDILLRAEFEHAAVARDAE